MRASVLVLALCMLLTGTINTIATKYQDITVVGHLPDGTPITFKHPAVQSACMFFGESLCLIPYFYMRWRKRKAKRLNPAYVPMAAEEKRSRRISRILAFAVPTLCDATGTTFMNVGLFYTYASTYQMLRGTLVLFAGMFTISILRRQLYIHNWLGMVLITAGAALVGASSVLYQTPTGHNNTSLMPAAVGLGLDSFNTTTAAGLHLHYSAGYSRVASRGMLDLRDNFAESASSIGTSVSAAAAGTRAAGLLGRYLGGSSGSSSVLGGESSDVAAAPLFGDLLVVIAQMFTALQFIMEEKYLVQFKVPALLAVGLEGCWGLVLCGIALPLASVIKGTDGLPLDDAAAAFRAILSNPQLGLAVYSSILSIAFFNFFGVSVTKSLSGAARATIDACRTLFIWLYALHAGWERFHMLEVVGFLVLISGTSLYNEILKSCLPGTSPVTGQQPPHPPRQRRRAAPAGQPTGPSTAARPAPDELVIPLLADGAADEGEDQSGRLTPGSGSRAPPVPLRRPAPAHTRVIDAAQSCTGDGSWVYTMARSMRMGIHTLSPQSLAATGGLAPEEGSEYSGSESGSYLSSTPGGLLASSLRQEGGLGDVSPGYVPTGGIGSEEFAGVNPRQWQGSGSGRPRVSFGALASSRDGAEAAAGPGGDVGSESARVREGTPTGASSSGLRPAIRRSSPGLGMQRSASFGSLPAGQDSSSLQQAGSWGRPPRSPQQ